MVILLKSLKKARQKHFMEAIAAGSAMVAFADGLIRPEEAAKLLDYIRIDENLKIFDSIEVIETFEKYIENFQFDFNIGREKAFKAIQEIEKNSQEAKMLILVCCAIGASDGDFDNNQRLVVREMCRILGMNPNHFDLNLRAPRPEDFPQKTLKAQKNKNMPEWMKNPPKIKKTPRIKPDKQANIPEWMKNPPKHPKTSNNKNQIPDWMKKDIPNLKKHQNKKDNLPDWMKKK